MERDHRATRSRASYANSRLACDDLMPNNRFLKRDVHYHRHRER